MKYSNQIFSCLVIIGLCLLPATPVCAGTVVGAMLMKNGTPMAGGKVIVFLGDKGPPPKLSEDFRRPDFVEDLNNEGAFRINLDAGKYYFGAIKWLDGGPGEPIKGDSFFIMADKPIQVPEEGQVDLGIVALGEIVP